MKRAAVITVAGTSSRFSSSLGQEVCKVIYSEGLPQDCLLYHQLSLLASHGLDLIVVVGGYMFRELKRFLDQQAGDWPISLVYNEHYRDYDSGHSLALGLTALMGDSAEALSEVLFLEGDLLFDAASLYRIIKSPLSVVTVTGDLIRANVSVAFYVSSAGKLRYIYDTTHEQLEIPEPFKIMGNSGQVWKFANTSMLRKIMDFHSPEACQGTNLVLISDYFSQLSETEYEFIKFEEWINCNNINDYRRAMALRKASNDAEFKPEA